MKETVSAGGVVLNSNNEILVINQNASSWSFPKGHVEEGENLIEAAKREIFEESGVEELQYVKDLGDYKRYKLGKDNSDDTTELKHIFMFLFTTPQMNLNPQDEAIPEARWVKVKEITKSLTHQKDKDFFTSKISEINIFIQRNKK